MATVSATLQPHISNLTPFNVSTNSTTDENSNGTLSNADIQRLVTLGLLITFAAPANLLLVLTIWAPHRTCRGAARSHHGYSWCCRCRSLRRTCADMFIINLAVGDLLVTVFTMSTEMLFVVSGGWVLGEALCKLSVYIQMITLGSTTFLLTSMSVDCQRAICRPLSTSARRTHARRAIIISWLLPLLLASPQLLIFVLVERGVYDDGSRRFVCVSKGYTADWQRKVYFTWLTTYIYLIPAVIITICYTRVLRAVYRRTLPPRTNSLTNKAPSSNSNHNVTVQQANIATYRQGPREDVRKMNGVANVGTDGSTDVREQICNVKNVARDVVQIKDVTSRSKIRTMWLTLAIVGGFILLWAPYFIVTLLEIYGDGGLNIPTVIYVVAETMALGNSVKNPLIYLLFKKCTSSEIRKRSGAGGTVLSETSVGQANNTGSGGETATSTAASPHFRRKINAYRRFQATRYLQIQSRDNSNLQELNSFRITATDQPVEEEESAVKYFYNNRGGSSCIVLRESSKVAVV